MKAKTILFPTDFSHSGDSALEYAASLFSNEQGGKLIVVHVQESPLAYTGEMYYGIAEPPAEELERMLANIRPKDAAIPVEHRLLIGDPADEIVRLAKDEAVDLIVLGSHGRQGFVRLLMGSVA